MLKKQIKNTVLSFIIILPVIAQSQAIRFNHISIEDGLSQNMVRDLIQDSRGFMWIATWDGLCRYDGYEFKVYKHVDGDTTSLRINKITCLLEDHSERLWIGTFGGGLSLFNREEENFTTFINKSANKKSITSDKIVSLFEDSKKRIWIGTQSLGVSLLIENNVNPSYPESETIEFINFKNDSENPSSISANGVLSICEDGAGNIWFAPIDGSLNKLVEDSGLPGEFKFISFQPTTRKGSNIRDNSFDFILKDILHPEIFWLVDYYSGLSWFDTEDGIFLSEYPEFNFPEDFPGTDVQSIMVGKNGSYWLGTFGNGIYKYTPGDDKNLPGSINHLVVNTADVYGMETSDIASIYQDRNGLIWIGTQTHGVYTFNQITERFVGYFRNPFDENSLVDDNVLSVMEDEDGNVWIGTQFGLDKYNPESDKYIHYKSSAEDPGSISSDLVYSLHQDSKGTIWVGTSKGLDEYIPSTNSFEHYLYDPHNSKSISDGEIIKIFSDSKGSLWIGTWNGGLNKLLHSTIDNKIQFLHYRDNENDPSSISDNRIMSLAESSDGKLWIGTSDGGLNLMISDYSFLEDGSISKPKFISYQHDPNNPNSLSNNDVRTIYIDSSNVLWLGTFGGGLNRFSPPVSNQEKAHFIRYRQTDGLANDVVRGILQDEVGNLWIGTANGLSKFNPEEKIFWNFDFSDGLQTARFEDVSYKCKKNGRMYFGGVGGVVSFLPSEIIINNYLPEVLITSFKRYNKPSLSMIDEKGISEKKKIVLSYDDNILNFEFSALSFFNSSKNSYAYKLEGYNDSWIQLGNKRDVTFTNLDPGTYTLFIKGSNNDGIWSENNAALEVTITPPWWRTNIAFVVYGFLFIAGIFVTDRVMRKKLINRERNSAKLREAELIKNQAEELETVDRLVRVVNRAEDLDNLFNSLLKQTMSFIPSAEKAAVFLLDKKDALFKVAFTAGYKVKDLEKISFTADELKKRYTEKSEELEKGIYVVRNTENLYGEGKLSGFSKANSMLVMAVERENILEAFVVFDSFSDEQVFDSSAARILDRFREHAVSAISKAQSIKSLQDKNEEIVKTHEQLVFQQKLASLGVLTAGIAHEIKNPLNFINNFSELSSEMIEELRDTVESEKSNLSEKKYKELKELSDTLKENIERINNHGDRADSIIKGMLLHSRGSSGERALTNINDLLDQFLKLAYHGLRAQNKDFNITIEKYYDESIEKMNVVPQDISRVFLNLINNACYAATEKKHIVGDGFEPTLNVCTKNLGDKVNISIRDNGNGIPPSIRKNLFNPFFTTKPVGEGTGLGLSLSYDIIVKEHKGEIKFETEEGKFTEFIILLPKQ